MFKSLLFLLALCPASAATMIATVTCYNGSSAYTVSVTPDASCLNAGDMGPYSALATASNNVPLGARVSIDTSTAQQGLALFSTRASAEIDATYIFTFTGGTGGGFFAPCLYAFGAAAVAMASFGPVGIGGGTYCPPTAAGAIPFTDGVPQQFHLLLQVYSLRPGGFGEADLGLPGVGGPGAFVFWDANGDPLSNVSLSVLDVTTPEPGSFAGCGLTLSTLLLLRRRGRQ